MDDGIFKKLKAKPGMTAALLYTPPEYPDYKDFSDVKNGKDDFVHLFVTGRAEFNERFAEAAEAVADGGLLWVSYPKSKGKLKYDINRDSLWEMVIPKGWHPVSQVSLDDEWSAIRLKPNEEGVVYEPPSNVKASASKNKFPRCKQRGIKARARNAPRGGVFTLKRIKSSPTQMQLMPISKAFRVM